MKKPDDDALEALYECPGCAASYHPDFLHWSTNGTLHEWRCDPCLDAGYGGWKPAITGESGWDHLDYMTYSDYLKERGS